MKRLPSLDSLRAFEVAARHLSFTRAAGELNVTQSALSHRVQALEDELGVALFRRLPRRLELTVEGEALAAGVRRGLVEIRRSLAAIDRSAAGGPLVVSVLPSFAQRWLVPRLARFRARQPEVEVAVMGDPGLADLRAGRADVAIRFGLGRYPGLHVVRLMEDSLFPVASPALVPRPLDTPADLARMTLLHDLAAENDASGSDWRSWLQSVGAPEVPCDGGPRFNQAYLLLEAAASGLGVALGRRTLVEADLRSGRLVRVLPHEAPCAFSYYIVCLPEAADRPAVVAFRDWLFEEAAAGAAQRGEPEAPNS